MQLNEYKMDIPVIDSQHDLSILTGYNDEYLHRITNAPRRFYKTFYIEKCNAKKRRIDEPHQDLKNIQWWILEEILYKIPCSRYAKAYIRGCSIKQNTRFHKHQEIVMTVDVSDFFKSIKSGSILNIFLQCGYILPVSVMLTRLCCLNDSLPQGAPTSAYISNIVMKDFDESIGRYCIDNKYRYTRYADDMTFSGNLKVGDLLDEVDFALKFMKLKRNTAKLRIMRKGTRQIVTGIVVNDKQQLRREYRMKIRQEVYYINKYGLESHLNMIGEERAYYVNHLLGKVQYCLFINPKDEKMKEYLKVLRNLGGI